MCRFQEHLKVISDHRKRFNTREWWQRFLQESPWPPERAFETQLTVAAPRSNTMPGTYPDSGTAVFPSEVPNEPSAQPNVSYISLRKHLALCSAFVAMLGSLAYRANLLVFVPDWASHVVVSMLQLNQSLVLDTPGFKP